MPHRFGDEAAQGDDALLERGAARDVRAGLGPQPPHELVPEPLVRPVLEPLVHVALEIVAASVGRPHAGERKAVLVVAIDQLVMAGGTSASTPSQPNG